MNRRYYENKFYSSHPQRIRRLIQLYSNLLGVDIALYADYYQFRDCLQLVEEKDKNRKRSKKSLINYYSRSFLTDHTGVGKNALGLSNEAYDKYVRDKEAARVVDVRWNVK